MEKPFTIYDHPTYPYPNKILILSSRKMRLFSGECRLHMDHLVFIDASRWLTIRSIFVINNSCFSKNGYCYFFYSQ